MKSKLLTFVSAGDFARGYLRFARFSTSMSANWPLMSVNVFLVGYGGLWCAMSVNGLARSVAMEMVVNGVLQHALGRKRAQARSMNGH